MATCVFTQVLWDQWGIGYAELDYLVLDKMFKKPVELQDKVLHYLAGLQLMNARNLSALFSSVIQRFEDNQYDTDSEPQDAVGGAENDSTGLATGIAEACPRTSGSGPPWVPYLCSGCCSMQALAGLPPDAMEPQAFPGFWTPTAPSGQFFPSTTADAAAATDPRPNEARLLAAVGPTRHLPNPNAEFAPAAAIHSAQTQSAGPVSYAVLVTPETQMSSAFCDGLPGPAKPAGGPAEERPAYAVPPTPAERMNALREVAPYQPYSTRQNTSQNTPLCKEDLQAVELGGVPQQEALQAPVQHNPYAFPGVSDTEGAWATSLAESGSSLGGPSSSDQGSVSEDETVGEDSLPGPLEIVGENSLTCPDTASHGRKRSWADELDLEDARLGHVLA